MVEVGGFLVLFEDIMLDFSNVSCDGFVDGFVVVIFDGGILFYNYFWYDVIS